MEIIVPLDKPPLPHPRSRFANVVRTFAIIGFVGFILLFSMILAEGKVGFTNLQLTLGSVGIGLLGLLLTWRLVRVGGFVIAAGMVLALRFTPKELLEWRPWFYTTEACVALIGILLLLAPRAAPHRKLTAE